MPRSLADGKKKFTILPDAPADINAITVTEANAGKDYSCAVLSSDFDLGFAASDMIDEKALCVEGNAQALGNSNFQGGFTAFREFLADTGLPDPAALAEELWDLVKEKGNTLHIMIRHSAKKSGDVWVVGDEYVYVEWVNDLPQGTTLEGYIKHRVEGAPQNFSSGYQTVVADPSP
ncbi:phage tail tube protein [Jonesia denitrificans]|uniref:Uncharacterized protein n=1 Tax=Jonesia denitrificans (strain ATCC 14870 / DSM 20603 / BCRC 15368 / CIP 55.134 / JCM 11481 / NBRC 15587 / NCTC 10816 / Prevot 55134) TaxID=471856 RepID=C7R1H6_JONDD|nr:hypothetical protein [Jonesia denitrificans]ACV09811.1 hypothetical protein Jden_2174 [Jonesia denitrificans DSM 20603]ASE08989.1 hypothetical protein CEP80_07465 [Jonesia denitrificans]QXB43535.1 hypothetical protein I6L70_01115 [Jonesia denitrificans]SQH22453.1 Uncharacterised protein [Jonesia denitrificans]